MSTTSSRGQEIPCSSSPTKFQLGGSSEKGQPYYLEYRLLGFYRLDTPNHHATLDSGRGWHMKRVLTTMAVLKELLKARIINNGEGLVTGDDPVDKQLLPFVMIKWNLLLRSELRKLTPPDRDTYLPSLC
jgi:hypothetical protein